jgi:acyl-CoA synthetase (AMP-forming)/AMP-acid ligase II
LEHPAVAEAGMIGKPDEFAGQIIKAFVALKPGYEPNDGLRKELIGFARTRLGPAVAPRELEFMAGSAQNPQRQDPAPTYCAPGSWDLPLGDSVDSGRRRGRKLVLPNIRF